MTDNDNIGDGSDINEARELIIRALEILDRTRKGGKAAAYLSMALDATESLRLVPQKKN